MDGLGATRVVYLRKRTINMAKKTKNKDLDWDSFIQTVQDLKNKNPECKNLIVGCDIANRLSLQAGQIVESLIIRVLPPVESIAREININEMNLAHELTSKQRS